MNTHQRLMIGYGAASSVARPVILAAQESTNSSGTSHAVSLPAGTSAGQLCIIISVIAAVNSTATLPSGFARIDRRGISGTYPSTMDIYWKVLSAADTSATLSSSAAGIRASVALIIQAGTFSAATPVTLNNTGFGASTSATVAAGFTSFPAAGHLFMTAVSASGVSASLDVSAYAQPYQQHKAVLAPGSGRALYGLCFGEFDGGLTPSLSFTLSVSEPWRTSSLVVNAP